MHKMEFAPDGFMMKAVRGAQMWVLLSVVLGASLGSAQQPQNGNAGAKVNGSATESRAPRNGDDRAQSGAQSARPGADARPNKIDPPGSKPGRPGSGPFHPPGRPAPKPPAHFYPQPGHSHPGYPHQGQPHYGYPRSHYVWGGGNGWRLRHFFLGDMRPINHGHRHRLFIGGYFPRTQVAWIQPIPQHLMVYLPPVPPGYEIGYFDGYCMIYDPYTLRIESVVDLYRY